MKTVATLLRTRIWIRVALLNAPRDMYQAEAVLTSVNT
jgi:hypothetical protein